MAVIRKKAALMHTAIESGDLYTPEVASVIAGGSIPAYNVFPFSAVNRDLSGLLDRNADFANNVQSAASGMMAGLVYTDPQTLASDVLFCGRQIEAARQLERQQQASGTVHEHKAEQPEKEKELRQHDKASPSLAAAIAGHKKLPYGMNTPNAELSPATSDSIAALGKSLGSFIKSEFTVSLPTAMLGTHTPAYITPSSGLAGHMALAA